MNFTQQKVETPDDELIVRIPNAATLIKKRKDTVKLETQNFHKRVEGEKCIALNDGIFEHVLKNKINISVFNRSRISLTCNCFL